VVMALHSFDKCDRNWAVTEVKKKNTFEKKKKVICFATRLLFTRTKKTHGLSACTAPF
jgi:hypothetical protein